MRLSLYQNKVYSYKEGIVHAGLFLSALVSLLTTLGITFLLFQEAYFFFQKVPLHEFFLGTTWNPLLVPKSFGVLPLLAGTLLVVVIAALIALPLGLITAVFLCEYASDRIRKWVQPILEILAGIPTVVYGYFALSFVTPFLKNIFPSIEVFNALSASIVVGIMILPMVASLCVEALRSVPDSLREGAFALGATRVEVSLKVIVPAALSGIMASFILAISRALGETMAVSLAAGSTPKMTLNPLESIQTMTSFMVQVSLGDVEAGSIEYQSLFAVGALLFALTFLMNFFAHKIMRRFYESY